MLALCSANSRRLPKKLPTGSWGAYTEIIARLTSVLAFPGSTSRRDSSNLERASIGLADGASSNTSTLRSTSSTDAHVMVTMTENVEKATRPQLQDLVQLLVERVKAVGRTVDPESIGWTPPARPFFGEAA
jgi:hypothetical protein